MYGLFWELSQQRRIWEAEMAAGDAKADARYANSRAIELERAVETLVMINMAMAKLLHERGVFSEQELETKVREIDLSDGKLDGKVRLDPKPCPQCKRIVAARRARCLYCGASMYDARP
ncbi:MAG: hypothetical protein IT434_11610 [Phycisphaerales bacterium]|nr:hypothetical protein [Phycisphaerales bacterium]